MKILVTRVTDVLPRPIILFLAVLTLTSGSYSTGVAADKVQPPGATTSFKIRVTGPPETVYDYATSTCPIKGVGRDTSDSIPRAYRDAAGNVRLFANNQTNRQQFIGPSLNSVQRVGCQRTLVSERNPDPSAYGDREWLVAFYTLDGKNVTGLVHNEYHGFAHPGQCSIQVRTLPVQERAKAYDLANQRCWMSALTFAQSQDGGNTFQRPSAPQRLVAALPYMYKPDIGRLGIGNPSNIMFNPKDGYYYFMASVAGHGVQRPGMCLLRNKTLNPQEWRAWNGKGFTTRLINPYSNPKANPKDHVCSPIPGLAQMRTLTYNSFADQFVAMGGSRDSQGKTVPRYTFSQDLINWSQGQIVDGFTPAIAALLPRGSTDKRPTWYYSFLSPDSPARNFDITNQRGYVYFIFANRTNQRPRPGESALQRIQRIQTNQRLMRIPVVLEKQP